MSFGARLIHTLTHSRTVRDSGALDEYGQPTAGTPTTAAVRGLVQPKSVREMDDSRSAGTEVADHTIFLPRMDLHPSDSFTFGGDRYEIVGIRDYNFGKTPHLEVDARRIDADVAA